MQIGPNPPVRAASAGPARFSSTPGITVPEDRVQFSSGQSAPAPVAATPGPTASKTSVVPGLALAGLAFASVLGGVLGPGIAHAAGAPASQVQEQPAAVRTAPPKTLKVQDEYHPLAYQEVRFGKPPVVRNFGKAPVKLASQQGRTDKGNLSLRWSTQTLTDAKGTPLWTPSGQGEVMAEFSSEATQNWTHNFRLQPAGAVGPYVSMVVSESGFTGGSPNSDARLVTVDSRTGTPVRLEQLIEPLDLEEVVGKIREVQGYVPGAQSYQASPSDLKELVNTSFALFSENGQTKLAVAIPNSVETADGTVAEYVFRMPSTAFAK